MKKLLLCLTMLIGLIALAPAQAVVKSIMQNDFKGFKTYLSAGSSLQKMSGPDSDFVLYLIYFSDENFEKACRLVWDNGCDFDKPSKTGVTLLYLLARNLEVNKIKILLRYKVNVNKEVKGVLPIQATQFATYPYHTEQKIDPECFEKEKEIHKLLLKKGSKPFSYLEPTVNNFGNFLFCFSYAIYQYNRTFDPMFINTEDAYNIYYEGEREIASFKYENLPAIYKKYANKDGEFYYYTDNIIEKLNEARSSSNRYVILAFTGNNKLAPRQWVLVRNFRADIYNMPIENENDYFECINSDTTFDYARYLVKDISEIILIKIN